MRRAAVTAAALAAALALAAAACAPSPAERLAEQAAVVERYCVDCHDDAERTAGLSFESMRLSAVAERLFGYGGTNEQRLARVELLLEHGADARYATPEGETALMTAARAGDVAAIRALLAAGADPNARERRKGQTALLAMALHGAVYRGGAVDIIRFLAERGAKLDVVNGLGRMPVTAADGVEYTPDVLKRYPEAAALLRELMAAQGLPVPASTQPGRGRPAD